MPVVSAVKAKLEEKIMQMMQAAFLSQQVQNYTVAAATAAGGSRQYGRQPKLLKGSRPDVEEQKAKTHCHVCGQLGHWGKDIACPLNPKNPNYNPNFTEVTPLGGPLLLGPPQ